MRQPFDLVPAGVRALGLTGADGRVLSCPAIRQARYLPMRLIGQALA